jgi:hypothetical protein
VGRLGGSLQQAADTLIDRITSVATMLQVRLDSHELRRQNAGQQGVNRSGCALRSSEWRSCQLLFVSSQPTLRTTGCMRA